MKRRPRFTLIDLELLEKLKRDIRTAYTLSFISLIFSLSVSIFVLIKLL
jgi:hypothetical protein